MSTTPRPWFAGYWGGQCRQPHFPHPGAGGGCVYEPTRHEFYLDDDFGCMFAGIGAENGENVLSSTYEGLEITPDNLRFIVCAANAHDALVAALRGVVARLAIVSDPMGHNTTALRNAQDIIDEVERAALKLAKGDPA